MSVIGVAERARLVLMRARAPMEGLLPSRGDLVAMGQHPRQDLVAGLTVAVVALPLALAFGVASGLGAQAGLATAVVAGIVAAVFGGSNLQVSGPTGAMTVVLVPVVHEHGSAGVLMVGAMAGLLLVIMAAGRIGRWVRYLPVSVIEGFTAGIAVVILLQQTPAALGISDVSGEKVWATSADAVGQWVRDPQYAAPALALAVAALMLGGSRWRPGLPFSLVGVALATVVAHLAGWELAPVGELPSTLPAPSWAFVDLGALGSLLAPALAVATLAAVESLLCATVADGMSVNQRHDPDRELFGQGLANLVTPLFGGIPATAAIARTAVNVRAGARSRLASVTHSAVLLVVIFAAAPLVSSIPLAALAGVLFATCIKMVDAGPIRALLRATRGDALILVTTFVVTVMIDLVAAVGVGVGLAVVLALRAVAKSVRMDVVPLEAGDHTAEEHALLSQHIVAFRLDGPLFFAAAHRVLLDVVDVVDVKVVILRMSRVSAMDATGAQILGDTIDRLEHRDITVIVSGIARGHDDILSTLGVGDRLRREGRIFATTPEAIAHAKEIVAKEVLAKEILASHTTEHPATHEQPGTTECARQDSNLRPRD